MCSVDEQITISNEVKVWMRDNKLFTSVDIGNALKEKGNFIRNRDVASYLRGAFQTVATWAGVSYVQTPIDVILENGGTAEASLYYPFGADPTEYTARSQKALPPMGARPDGPPADIFLDTSGTKNIPIAPLDFATALSDAKVPDDPSPKVFDINKYTIPTTG
jgi:hypothetical protein